MKLASFLRVRLSRKVWIGMLWASPRNNHRNNLVATTATEALKICTKSSVQATAASGLEAPAKTSKMELFCESAMDCKCSHLPCPDNPTRLSLECRWPCYHERWTWPFDQCLATTTAAKSQHLGQVPSPKCDPAAKHY